MTIQLAPTMYHQCQLMISLLQRYNWTDFSLVTTTESQYLEFINSINKLVEQHNSKRGVTMVNRYSCFTHPLDIFYNLNCIVLV